MTDLSSIRKQEVEIEFNKVNSLIKLAQDRGINCGFEEFDLREIVDSSPDEPAFALNRLRNIHRHLHELLYAPPSK